MDNWRLDMLRRIFKIMAFAVFFLIFGSLSLAGKLGLVDPNAVVKTPLFWFAVGVMWVLLILWGLFATWLELKDPYNTAWLYVHFWLFWDKVTRKIRGKGR
jgi:uncharacterized membrane protein